MAKRIDLTGQRFGRLTVLRPAENVGGKTAWVCRCDCGKEVIVKSTSLQTGHTKTCGHRRGAGNPLGLTLAEGTCVEMLQTKKVQKNNTSGMRGVEWLPDRRQWKATICFKRKRYYLGCYSAFEDAVEARKQAEDELYGSFLLGFANAQIHCTTEGQ